MMESAAPISVVELRQYTLHKGKRDELISLFEREFVAPQEALHMHLLGLFRDLDDPDRFVWLRGFRDMPTRKAALETFYGGPIWKAHRAAANATMRDSDNVLLLRVLPGSEALIAPKRVGQPGLIRAAIHTLRDVDASAFADHFESQMRQAITNTGADVLGTLSSEPSPNDFRLPVREDEPVFVWFARFDDATEERRFTERWNTVAGLADVAPDDVLPALMRKPEVLRLAPTARSSLD